MIKLLRQIHYLFSRQDFIRFGLLAVLLISVGLLELASLSAVPVYISSITGHLDASPYYQKLPDLLKKLSSNFFCFSLFFVALYLLRAVYLQTVTRIQFHILSNRNIALTGRIYRALLNAPYSFILSHQQAFLTQVLTRNTYYITYAILYSLLTLTRCLFLSLLTAGLILSFHFRLSLLAVSFLILTCGIHMLRRSRFLKRAGAAVNHSQQQAILAVNETLQAVPETKIYQLQDYFMDRMHSITQRHSLYQGQIQTRDQTLWPHLEVFTLLSLISSMLIIMHADHKTPLELAPALTLLTIALTRLKVLFSESMLALNNIFCHKDNLDQTYDLLHSLDTIAPLPEQACGSMQFNQLKLEHVNFSYAKSVFPIIRDLSFTLKRGQSMGITGPTGCGKSTLLNILLGLLRPQSGTITLNQEDLAPHTRQWQSMIGYVPQNIAMFDDTILHNIAPGIPDDQIDMERFRDAVNKAMLDDFLIRQPLHEQTVIGEQGKNLSGGERQRIGIARALYKKPEILILDEATSALDHDTEQAITETIRQLKEKVTMIIVAHRLSTISQCDFILKMQPPENTRPPKS